MVKRCIDIKSPTVFWEERDPVFGKGRNSALSRNRDRAGRNALHVTQV